LDQAEAWLKEMLARGDGILPAEQTLFMVQVDRLYPLTGKKREEQLKKATKAGETWLQEILRRKDYYLKKADSLSSNQNLSGKVIVVIENEMKKRYEHFVDLELQARGLLHSLYFRSQNQDRALAHLNKILEIDPTRADEYYNRGQIYLRLGQRKKAKKDLETFLRLSSITEDSPRWKEVNRQVAKLALELRRKK
jgi:tetratricopeptide (TPR) repeat protein